MYNKYFLNHIVFCVKKFLTFIPSCCANPDPVGVFSVFQFDSDHYSAPDNVDNSGFSLSRHVLASLRKVNLNKCLKKFLLDWVKTQWEMVDLRVLHGAGFSDSSINVNYSFLGKIKLREKYKKMTQSAEIR